MNRKVIRVFTLVVSLFLTMGISSEIAAQKGPTQGEATFYYGGTWILHQDGLSPITMEIQRIGSEITGKASYDAGREGISRGTVQGRAWSETYEPIFMAGVVTINHFEVEIRWHNAVGVYHAKDLTIENTPFSSLEGEAWSKAAPNVIVKWHTDKVFRHVAPVAQPAAQPAAPAPKPIKSSGKMPPAATKPPFITAGQPFVQPSLPYASVFLGWDGGPDHPNVEVWMSINNGAEIPAFSIDFPPQHPIFKQPKVPSIEMKLSKGRSYKFTLRDGGFTLSTVAFYVP